MPALLHPGQQRRPDRPGEWPFVQLWPHVHGTDGMFFAPAAAPIGLCPCRSRPQSCRPTSPTRVRVGGDRQRRLGPCRRHGQPLRPEPHLGLPIVESLLKVTPIPIDCHLMIDDPDRWGPGYAEAGAGSVTFHVEAASDPVRLARATSGDRREGRLRPQARDSVRALCRPARRGRHGARHDRGARLRRAVAWPIRCPGSAGARPCGGTAARSGSRSTEESLRARSSSAPTPVPMSSSPVRPSTAPPRQLRRSITCATSCPVTGR